jgi:anti-anti-sigma factor
METNIREIDGNIVATLAGELDTAAAVEVEQGLKGLYNNEGKDIVFECKDLEYIASSGLRILLSILKGAKANGHKVVLRDVNEDIKNVFELTGFISLFVFE